jgi:hypothetical protein
MVLPPYSRTHSTAPSSATIGSSQDNGTTAAQTSTYMHTVSLTVGIGVDFKLGPLGANFNASVTGHLAWTSTHSKAFTRTTTTGDSFTLLASPDLDGYDGGGVITSCGCFHQYDYELDDPAGALGGPKGQSVSVFLPVGGQTTFFSTRRYNALADALGGKLPKIAIPYKLGEVESYPTLPVTLEGKPIPAADLVFTKIPPFRTSDVGDVAFTLTDATNVANTEASSFSKGVGETVGGGLGIVTVSGNNDQTWTLDNAYTITVGNAATFAGNVRAVRDDPTTPENEFDLYGYSFQPVVYRHHYTPVADPTATGGSGTTPNGKSAPKDAAFFVLTYTVGK